MDGKKFTEKIEPQKPTFNAGSGITDKAQYENSLKIKA